MLQRLRAMGDVYRVEFMKYNAGYGVDYHQNSVRT